MLGVRFADLALFAVGLLVLTVTWNGIRVAGGALGNVFLTLAFVAVIVHAIVDKRPLPLPRWLCVAGVGFLLAGLLSVIFPPSVGLLQRSLQADMAIAVQDGVKAIGAVPSNTGTLLKFEAALVLVPVLIATVGTTPDRCRALISLWTLGAIVNAAVGVADFSGIAHLTPVALSQNRSAGLTIQSNYLALTCVLAIPTAMLWLGRSRRWTLAGVIGVLALLGGVYASGSRAGTVAALIALAATVVLVPRLRRGLKVLLPIAGVALVLTLMFTNVGAGVVNQVRLGSGNTSAAVSDSQRSLLAQVAFDQVKVRPIEGVGFSVITNAHDIYLELLDAGGLIALASFAVFIGGVGGAAGKSLHGPLREEGLVLAIAIAAWLLNGIFDNQVADKYLYIVPGLLLATSRTTWLETVADAGHSLVDPVRVPLAQALARAGVASRL